MSHDYAETAFGFRWGKVKVERLASQSKPRREFQVIRVTAPNGDGVDVMMTPRKMWVQRIDRDLLVLTKKDIADIARDAAELTRARRRT